MILFIEKLSVGEEKKQISFDGDSTAEEMASLVAFADQDTTNAMAEMGDVIHVGAEKFLVEAHGTVTAVEEDEYLYYKGIDASERVARWFEGSIN